jgi:rod shape determining protein RodA
MDKFFKGSDPVLLIAVLAIFSIALLSLYSASHQPDGIVPRNFALQQMVWMGLIIILFIGILWMGYERLLDYAYLIFALNILLLILVLILGNARLGAKRWISLGLFNLQPSELCKVSFILVLARYIGENKYRLDDIKIPIVSVLICIVPVLLIIKQPDLGTAIAFIPVLFIVLFVAGARIKHLFCLMLVGLITSPVVWHILKGYQKKRLLVFLNPDIDPLGAGYTVIQSKIAVGSGGFFGKGWLSGTQNQLNFLPERHTDFIFSVIGEEWGFFGAILLLGLFLLLIRQLLKIAEGTYDLSAKLLIIGAATLLWFQIFINIAMTIGVMPVVGLPLPLVSYGGSSLLTTMVLIALAISAGSRRKIF